MSEGENEQAEGAAASGPCPVVGIGASAGGVEPLTELFAAAPADAGVAWVAVIHMMPDQESHLGEILSRKTEMKVEQVTDAVALQPDHVYVIAPGTTLTLEDGDLHARPYGEGGNGGGTENGGNGRRTPVDHLFMSLAEVLGERCACAVLSGTGSDGTVGLRAVKQAGGFCLAQAPHSAAHREMPDAAIEAGLIDRELEPADIPQAAITFLRQQDIDRRRSSADGTRPDIVESLPELTRVLKQRSGEDFSHYKPSTLARRVLRRMQTLELDDPDIYLNRLQDDPDEARKLVGEVLIGVTEFFRNPDAFDALRDHAIADILRGRARRDPVRAWVVGCSTGEEAYSVAMLLLERARHMNPQPQVTVFASDVDEQAIEKAREGVYPESVLAQVPEALIGRYFDKVNGHYQVRAVLREAVLFSKHNVLRDPPFSRLDLVTCRNLLIYLETAMQARVLQIFHHVLKPQGWLMLGESEGIGRESVRFRQEGEQPTKLFRPRDEAPRVLPHLPLVPAEQPRPSRWRSAAQAIEGLTERIERTIVDRFAPAWVVVDRELTVRRFSPRTGKFLQPAAGQPSTNLIDMAREELRAPLRTNCARAVRTGGRVSVRDVTLNVDGAVQNADIVIEPVPEGEEGEAGEALYIIVFAESAPMMPGAQPHRRFDDEQYQRGLEQEHEADGAEEEIQRLREKLRTVTEELQTSNEELETSREELQSSNEELRTVNGELNERVEELARVNNDLRNLFQNTNVATLFVDNDLNIRNFTPLLGRVFPVVDTDKGRPLRHIAHRLDDERILDDIRGVLLDLQRVEREVAVKDDGTVYIMRIQPYYTLDSRIDGAVITFVDVTRMKESEERLRRAREHERLLQRELQHRVKNILANLRGLAHHTSLQSETLEQYTEAFEGRLEALARTQTLMSTSGVRDISLEDLLREEFLGQALQPDGSIEIAGPEIRIEPRAAQTVALVLHELTTNAVKYGALSTREGKIAISWRVESRGGQPHLTFEWRESGIEPKPAEARRGFGQRLIEESLPYELGGECRLEILPDGCRCRIVVPFESNIRRADCAPFPTMERGDQ